MKIVLQQVIVYQTHPRRTKHRRRNALLERQTEESLAFQPDEVDPARCQALRSARVQCHSAKVVSTDCCRVHQRNRYNGFWRPWWSGPG